jgi:hypothetical protein
MMPLGPQLMRLMAMTPAQFSHVVSSYTFAAGLSGILSAFFKSRPSRQRDTVSLASERHHRINFRRPPRGNPACQRRDNGQQQWNRDKRHRVSRAHPV